MLLLVGLVNNMKKRNLIIIVLILSIITICLSVSVAVFFYLGKGTTNNVIQTGKIVFSYSDAEGENAINGEGINIVEAQPIPDSQGKLLSKSNEYFDFSVSASTTYTDLAYEIVVNKQPTTTMDEGKVKIYLTEINGNSEVETEITGGAVTPTYKQLKDTDNNTLEGKTIYYGKVIAGEVAYGKNFRLRMWIADDQNTANTGTTEANESEHFTVKVNVAAIGND